MTYSQHPSLDVLLLAIGRKVRYERELLGYSQEVFAEKAGFHRTYIGMVERGEQNLTIQSCSKFAEACGMSVYSFFMSSLAEFDFPGDQINEIFKEVDVFEEHHLSQIDDCVFLVNMDGNIVYIIAPLKRVCQISLLAQQMV